MREVKTSCDLEDCVSVPTRCLGGSVSQWEFEDSKMCWCLSGEDCAKSAAAIERGLLIEKEQDCVGSKGFTAPHEQRLKT